MGTLEDRIAIYCKQRDIPIKDGEVPAQYRSEIMNFIKIENRKAIKRRKEPSRIDAKQALKPFKTPNP